MTKIFIIILNWNRYQDTHDCLKSLEKINKKNLDLNILVVDNGSKVEEIEKLKKIVPANSLILNNKNLGFAQGNNVGIRQALKNNADYVLVLNNDTFLDKNFLTELVSTAQKDKKIGALTSKIYFAKGYEFHKDRYKKSQTGKVIWSAGGAIDWNNIYATNYGVDGIDEGQFQKVKEVDFATGACVLYNANALKKVGVFDPRYFMYFEDVDLSMRLKKHGFKVVFVPKSVIWHKVAQSSGIGSNLNDYFITRNRLIFGFRFGKLRARIALIKEGIKFLIKGRFWQKIGFTDFLIGNLGKGSWK